MPPLFVLGVRRSGTTLLRVMLDRHSQLAVPDESYFVPQLADRHRRRVDPAAFLDDLARITTLRDWGLRVDDVRPRLRRGMEPGEAIGAVYEAYAALHGKPRWGDKTPMYMAHLGLLEKLFPDALYVHLVRDGRDAALSYLAVPRGIMTEAWSHPRDVAGFACQWRTEVRAARALGRRAGGRYLEISYEQLVDATEDTLTRICDLAGLPFEPGMTAYAGNVDVSAKPHQQRLKQPPTKGVRSWRDEMALSDLAAFEQIAGDVLAASGYELREPSRASGPDARARLALASYRARTSAWRAASLAIRRSPLWRRRHPVSASGPAAPRPGAP